MNFLRINSADWKSPPVPTYRCLLWLIPESDGGFSVLASTLPGCASQGDTMLEALANIKEALAAVLATYRDDGVPIPWCDEEPRPCPAAYRATVYVALEARP